MNGQTNGSFGVSQCAVCRLATRSVFSRETAITNTMTGVECVYVLTRPLPGIDSGLCGAYEIILYVKRGGRSVQKGQCKEERR